MSTISILSFLILWADGFLGVTVGVPPSFMIGVRRDSQETMNGFALPERGDIPVAMISARREVEIRTFIVKK